MPLTDPGVGMEMPAAPQANNNASNSSYTPGMSFWDQASGGSQPAQAPQPAANPSPYQQADPPQRGANPPQYTPPPAQTPPPPQYDPPQQGGNPPQYQPPQQGNAPSQDMWGSFNPQQQQWLQQMFGYSPQQQQYGGGYQPYGGGQQYGIGNPMPPQMYNDPTFNGGVGTYQPWSGQSPFLNGGNPNLFAAAGNAPNPINAGFGGVQQGGGPINGLINGGFGGVQQGGGVQQNNSPMSTGAPPWAASLTGGWSLPGFTGQGGYAPQPNVQQWNSMLPSEQMAAQQANQSITGMSPADFYQNLGQQFPNYYGATPMRYSGY